jgi:hypothetical protein
VGPSYIDAVLRDLKIGAILLYGAGGSKFDSTTGVRKDKAGLCCFQNINGALVPHIPAEIFDPDLRVWNVNPMYPDPCAPGL